MKRIDRARGARVNGMIDFTSGWLVANVGHDNRAVMRAVKRAHCWAVVDGYENPARKQAERAMHSILPEYLTELAFYNSGSEAMDAAVRFAKVPVYTLERSYHGSTIGAQELKNRIWTRDGLGVHGAAVLLETFLGPWCEWHYDAVISALSTLQREDGYVIMFDEMQAGFGRTGKWWGFEHYHIEPDILIGGKAMAGGLPMAFVATRAGFMNGPDHWQSTFSGNALCCAACAETIRIIKRRRLLERVQRLEPIIREALPGAQGRGFAYALPCEYADDIVDAAANRGLLLLKTHRQTIKVAPPLCISERDLRRGLEIIRSLL